MAHLEMFSFSLAMAITPGPANSIILSSGVNYGAKKTMPYVTGATIGFTSLLIMVGVSFYQFIQAYPAFLSYIALAGSLYIIYMGYKIATIKPDLKIKQNRRPKFLDGFLLQWLNPKAWLACVSGVSIFSSAQSYKPFMTFSIIYFFVCYASLSFWALLGDKVAILLNSPLRLRLFDLFMGAVLIATGLYLAYSHFAA